MLGTQLQGEIRTQPSLAKASGASSEENPEPAAVNPRLSPPYLFFDPLDFSSHASKIPSLNPSQSLSKNPSNPQTNM